jgi:hypothetical protein
MSAHGDPPAVVVEAHDAEPEDDLAPDEPRTPMWLPLVGSVLMLAGIATFVATRPPGKTGAELVREAEMASKARAAALKAAEPAPAPAPAPMPAMPADGQPRKGG